MGETQIIDRIRKLAASGYRHRTVVKGIGDDCAILRPASGKDLVFTSDFMLEGRHFLLETHSPSDIGHKALARSLSDLAAMGAEPIFCIVSLAIPTSLAGAWVQRFYKGLLGLADKYKTTLAGGDLSRFDKVVVDVMCAGQLPAGKAMLRSAAKPGDRIYITGQLGALARPEPRIREGIALRKLGVAAAMDVSDGISLDLHRLCRESKVGAELSGDLPVSPGATLDQALHRGEDYELLFTARPGLRIPAKINATPVMQIGQIVKIHPGRIYWKGKPLKPGGFDHFA